MKALELENPVGVRIGTRTGMAIAYLPGLNLLLIEWDEGDFASRLLSEFSSAFQAEVREQLPEPEPTGDCSSPEEHHACLQFFGHCPCCGQQA